MTTRTKPAMGALIFFFVSFGLCVYFTFAAVQGDFGLFRRAEIDAESKALNRAQLDSLTAQVSRMENLTHRLSDDYPGYRPAGPAGARCAGSFAQRRDRHSISGLAISDFPQPFP